MLFSIIQVNTVNHMLKGLNCCLDQVAVEYLRVMEESIKPKYIGDHLEKEIKRNLECGGNVASHSDILLAHHANLLHRRGTRGSDYALE